MPNTLAADIESYLESLRLENASEHTLRNYRADLVEFLAYFTPPDGVAPPVAELDTLALREWLGHLYKLELSPVTIRRKLAAVRSLFRNLLRTGVLPLNVAKLLRSPKAPKKLPRVMTAEQTNTLIEGVAADELQRIQAARDLAIFEVLYGCGIRVSELTGLKLADIDFSDRWILVRGKGRKERQVPFGSKAAAALERYLTERKPKAADETALMDLETGKLIARTGEEQPCGKTQSPTLANPLDGVSRLPL